MSEPQYLREMREELARLEQATAEGQAAIARLRGAILQISGTRTGCTVRGIILDLLRDGGVHGCQEVAEALTLAGKDRHAATSNLSRCVRLGEVERVGRGKYRLAQAPQ